MLSTLWSALRMLYTRSARRLTFGPSATAYGPRAEASWRRIPSSSPEMLRFLNFRIARRYDGSSKASIRAAHFRYLSRPKYKSGRSEPPDTTQLDADTTQLENTQGQSLETPSLHPPVITPLATRRSSQASRSEAGSVRNSRSPSISVL